MTVGDVDGYDSDVNLLCLEKPEGRQNPLLKSATWGSLTWGQERILGSSRSVIRNFDEFSELGSEHINRSEECHVAPD